MRTKNFASGILAAAALAFFASDTAHAHLIITNVTHWVGGMTQSTNHTYTAVGDTLQFQIELASTNCSIDGLDFGTVTNRPVFNFTINNQPRQAKFVDFGGNILVFDYSISTNDLGPIKLFADNKNPIQGPNVDIYGCTNGVSIPTEKLNKFGTPQFGGDGYYSAAEFNAGNDIKVLLPLASTIVPLDMCCAEGSRFPKVTVNFVPAPPTGSVFYIDYGDATNYIQDASPTGVVKTGSSFEIPRILALDDFAPVIVSITDANGVECGTFAMEATNCPPTIITPPENTERITAIGQDVSFYGTATDPANENDPLKYEWDFGDGGITEQTNSTPVTHAFGSAGSFTVKLTVSDGDGGYATRLLKVDVQNGNLLVVSAEAPGKMGLEGIGSGTFRITDPPAVWKPDGNRFPNTDPGAISAVSVQPVPDANSYPFAWSDNNEDVFVGPAKEIISSGEPVVVDMTEDRKISFYFSRAWHAFDNFGDIDADGLGDNWEAKWFGTAKSIDEDDLSAVGAVQAGGDFGPGGNPDADYLPGSSATVEIDNVLFNDGSKVRVFQYPITSHNGWEWYGYAPNPANPFNNLIEFRGLEEMKAGTSEWHRYAQKYPVAGDPNRGNCPATDPVSEGSVSNRITEVSGNDTDGDGLPDGWEYYFWTTIMYEVNPDKWIAFDNNFASYDFTNRVFTNSFLLGRYSKDALLRMFDPAVDSLDPEADPDNDGLTNFEEYIAGTNPLHYDTDDDGLPDGWEVLKLLDPLNGDSLGEHGAGSNPDRDYMAELDTPYNDYPIGKAQHVQVYELRRDYGMGPWNGKAYSGFHPRVGWEHVSGLSRDFTNYDEFMLAYYYMFMISAKNGVDITISPMTWENYTTNPRSNNTDGDMSPDGWELFLGVSPLNLGFADSYDFPMVMITPENQYDWDLDGLTGAQVEFSSAEPAALLETNLVSDATDGRGNLLLEGANVIWAFPNIYSTNNNPQTPWQNKLYPTDPWSGDTDGDGLPDGGEWTESADANGDGSWIVNLNPTCVDSDMDHLPDGWEYTFGLQTTNDTPVTALAIMGPYGDPDCDGLPNYIEYLTGINRGWRGDYLVGPNHDNFLSNPKWFNFIPPAYGTISSFDLMRPAPDPFKTSAAEPAYNDFYSTVTASTNPVVAGMEWMTAHSNEVNDVLWYAMAMEYGSRSFGKTPFDWDPAFKSIPQNEQFFFYSDPISSDPRKWDTDGDGMDDYFEIFHGMDPYFGSENTYGLKYFNDPRRTLDSWPFVGHNFPWTLGCPDADPDQDGLSSREESVEFYAQDIYLNSDPTPYWVTDTTYSNSIVNMYYQSGEWKYLGSDGSLLPAVWPFSAKPGSQAPQYMFDFEINEGFDTDNDNIADREELSTTDLRGITDPLDHSNPSSRKAMFFDGFSAACRTRTPYFHDKWSLASYTVELWFMAENPARGSDIYQTLIERPVVNVKDDQTGLISDGIRYTFRIQLTPDGRLRGEIQNDAFATFTTETAIENGTITSNTWYHLAVTMDSVKNEYTIYLNGSVIQRVKCGLKPCTGYFPYQQDIGQTGNELQQTDTFRISPAPLVVGASDINPYGIVCGSPLYSTNGIIKPPPEPEFEDFFGGWIDEIRVWDRVRTQNQIQNDMYKRYTMADVQTVNQKRFAWEQDNWIEATAFSEFPQKLLYHYSFDNVPDPFCNPPPEMQVKPPPSDFERYPSGIDTREGAPNGVDYVIPWWEGSAVRSTVYNTYFGYVPWAENSAAHLPQFPPLTIQRIMPVYDEDYNVIGYRKRRPDDWDQAHKPTGKFEYGLNPVEVGGVDTNETILDVDLIPNNANPYVQVYRTGIESGLDTRPEAAKEQVMYNARNYEIAPILSDLLILGGARADMNVELWDGNGPGYDVASIDSDGDGMPDWYEISSALDPYDANGINGAYGDYDDDGIDNYSEYLAGTKANSFDSDGDGVCDYFERDDEKSLTYGEIYDDGDGMPSDWEIKNRLDPNRYDADEDLDGDGWTNYEEYMAGTLPGSSSSFPTPKVTFNVYYNGTAGVSIPQIIFYGYSEGHSANPDFNCVMGGDYDAKWLELPNVVDEYVTIDKETHVGKLKFGMIVPTTLTGPDPRATTATISDTPLNDNEGRIVQSLFINYISGEIRDETPDGQYSGITFCVSYSHGYMFPAALEPKQTLSEGKNLRSGYNRFFGFFDINGNQMFDEGEPCGISTRRPTLVSRNDFEVEMYMSDNLFAYPRITWDVPTNGAAADSEVVLSRTAATPPVKIKVPAPRGFLHEGDLVSAGIFGLNFSTVSAPNFGYRVFVGTNEVKTGAISWNLGENGTRRKMKIRAPTEVIYGSVVDFNWEMDARTAGAKITLKSADGATTYYDGVVPIPVQHGGNGDAGMYFSAAPQLENGKKFFSLPDGEYIYTITENLPGTAVTAQHVDGRFILNNSGNMGGVYTNSTPSGGGASVETYTYSVSGVIDYYGKVNRENETEVLYTFDGSNKVVTGCVTLPAEMEPGTVTFRIVDDQGFTLDSSRDSGAAGILYPDAGLLVTGFVNYKTGEYRLEYSVPPPAGSRLTLIYKDFSSPIVIQAFRLPDTAESGLAAGGSIEAQVSQYEKGNYKISGLKAGKYAVRAFIDSNSNGILDGWESFGFASSIEKNVSPTFYSDRDPLVVPPNAVSADIVIFDRDTDDDRLPDAWEYSNFGNLDTSGLTYRNGVYVWQEYADGALDSNPNRIDTDHDGLSDAVEINTTHTDTHNNDTDGDGLSDVEEFLSGSDPRDASSRKRYATLALQFDESGNPYVECPYPELAAGNTITFLLRHQRELGDEWTVVCTEDLVPPKVIDGKVPAGVYIMKPGADVADWNTGFFKIDVQVDYQEFEINENPQ